MKSLIIIVLTLISLTINAQNIDNSTAQQLLEMEIQIWNSQNDSVKFSVFLQKAALYKSMKLYEQALFELNRADNYCKNPHDKSLLSYEKMLNYFLSGRHKRVKEINLSIEETNQIDKTREYRTMRLFSLNETEDWEKCKTELLLLCALSDTTLIAEITGLPVAYHYTNPEDCRRASTFLPGLGQAQAGYPFKSGVSFLIHSGLTAFIGYNFYTGYYLTGIVSGVFPLLKFYGGGKRLSAILAEERNEKEISNLKKKYSKAITATIK